MLRSLLLALLVLPSAHAQFAFLGLDEKCSACKAIVYELDRAMRFETPQENIRIGRQTLSTDGKRTGSSVDYKHSELRAITIIDNLCPTMQHYGKVVKEGESRWMRVNYAEGDVVIDGSMTLGGAKSETEGKALKLYCDKIVEEQEDEWVEATQAGVDQLEERICSDMMKVRRRQTEQQVQKDFVNHFVCRCCWTVDSRDQKDQSRKIRGEHVHLRTTQKRAAFLLVVAATWCNVGCWVDGS
jgi:hypothetical protein